VPTVEQRVDRLEYLLAEFIAHTDENIRELHAGLAESRQDAREREARTERDRQAWQRRWEETEARREQDRQEWQRRWEETETRREQERREWNRRHAELTDRLGFLVEAIVYPNCPRVFNELFPGETILRHRRNEVVRHPHDLSRVVETDVLVVGTQHVMVVEAKSKPRPEHLAEFLDKLRQLPEFYPELAGQTFVPVLASLALEESFVAALSNRRIYGLALGDETMVLVNKGAF